MGTVFSRTAKIGLERKGDQSEKKGSAKLFKHFYISCWPEVVSTDAESMRESPQAGAEWTPVRRPR